MALDPRFVLAYTFGKYFVDKDTGTPLAAGKIKFYRDSARTEPKSVYILAGVPPNYTYVDIGNIVSLNAVGMPQYLGANVALYFFPYDGDPEDSTGTVDLYYYTVESFGGVNQFNREAQPNVIASEDETTVQENFVPNPQFLSHIDLPETDQYAAGEIRQDVTDIAYGGWTYERSSASGATDIVIFQRFDSYITTSSPDGNPRYAVRVDCQVVGTASYKDIRLKFKDVNRFASDTDQYTLAFSARSDSGSSAQVKLSIIKNYGTGGSLPSTNQLPNNITVTPSYQKFSVSFTFGSNSGKTIGTSDDDFVQLALNLPTGDEFQLEFTDFILTPGVLVQPAFPPTTDEQMQYRSMAGFFPIPHADGSDLYLPLRLSSNGWVFDSSEIGNVLTESQLSVYDADSLHPSTNLMLADGKKRENIETYDSNGDPVSGYSPLGIPFSRLFNKYYDTTLKVPIWGTGLDYFTAYFTGSGNELIVTNNTAGSVAATADSGGGTATGFTFETVHTGATTYYTKAYMVNSTDTFFIENLEAGAADAPSAQDSGFTVSAYQAGNSILPEIVSVQTIAASSGMAGHMFWFDSWHSGATQPFYVWFKVDGAGSDPAPGGRTGILVNLNSTDSALVVAEKIRESLNGWQVSSIKTNAASTLTGGDYFTINATGNEYYVWFRKDAVGTDPIVAGRIPIRVDVLSADTNTQVADKIRVAINSKFFAVPDLRGLILRGWDHGAGVDTLAASRYSLVPGVQGDMLATFQLSGNKQHTHTITNYEGELGADHQALVTSTDKVSPVVGTFSVINPDGQSETTVKNAYVNYVIRY